jgi:hypothetical protein
LGDPNKNPILSSLLAGDDDDDDDNEDEDEDEEDSNDGNESGHPAKSLVSNLLTTTISKSITQRVRTPVLYLYLFRPRQKRGIWWMTQVLSMIEAY